MPSAEGHGQLPHPGGAASTAERGASEGACARVRARAISFCTSVFTQLDSFTRVALTTLTYVEPN